MVMIEEYKVIRQKLDRMGYVQPCPVDALLLVTKLLDDLNTQRQLLMHSENTTRHALAKCKELEESLTICKNENRDLFKQKNSLKQANIKHKEESTRKVKQLQQRIYDLENQYSDLEFKYMEQITNTESITQHQRLTLTRIDDWKWKTEEIECYKKEYRQLVDELQILEYQLQIKDTEIEHLKHQLDDKKSHLGDGSSDEKVCQCHLLDCDHFPLEEKEVARVALQSSSQDKSHVNRCEEPCACQLGCMQQNQLTFNTINDLKRQIKDLQVIISELTTEKEIEEKLRINKLKSKINKEEKEIETSRKEQKAREHSRQTQTVCQTKVVASVQTKQCDVNTDSADNTQYESAREIMQAERDFYINELNRLKKKGEQLEEDKKYQDSLENGGLESGQLRATQQQQMRLQEEVLQLRQQLQQLQAQNSTRATGNNEIVANADIHKLAIQIVSLTEQLHNCNAKYGRLKKLNLHLDLCLKNSQATAKQAELDLSQAIDRLQELQQKLTNSQQELNTANKEKQKIRENLYRLDNEKDQLLIKLDEKTVLISKLNIDLRCESSRMKQINDANWKLQTQLQTLTNDKEMAVTRLKKYELEVIKMGQEIFKLKNDKETLATGCKIAKRKLAAIEGEMVNKDRNLEQALKQTEDLKRELQTYVDEVRRVENILLEKERERELLLQQFNRFSQETADQLTSPNEPEKEEEEIGRPTPRPNQTKDYLVASMQQQIGRLSGKVVELQTTITEMADREQQFTTDVHGLRHLCTALEDQKQYYSEQLAAMVNEQSTLQLELDQLQHENRILNDELNQQLESNNTLDRILSSSRNEVAEKSVNNHQLNKQISEMAQSIEELKSKLNGLSQALGECQNNCDKYYEENVCLKRQLTNERFVRARECDSYSTSL